VKPDAFAKVFMDGGGYIIDHNGYIIGPLTDGRFELTSIQGLKTQPIVVGETLKDDGVRIAIAIIAYFKGDLGLSSARLDSVRVDDLTRIVCDLGMAGAEFQVIIDKDNIDLHMKMLSVVLSRTGLDLTLVKYMDLRFGEPLIGQKKAKE